MNMSESARRENEYNARSAAASAARDSASTLLRIEKLLLCKLDASRAALLSEWTDRDMSVGNVIYKAGSVTIADILDHAANEARLDLGDKPQ
jgi:hypothetical protein